MDKERQKMKNFIYILIFIIVIEPFMKIWWIQIPVYGLVSAALTWYLYKDVKYWIEEYKKKKSEPDTKKKRKWVITSWTKQESNPILYFFFLLLWATAVFAFVTMVYERFFSN